MATLTSAQTGTTITTDPASTVLTRFQTDWTATPAASAITFSRSFANMSKLYAVICKDFLSESPAQILGASRYRYTKVYKLHVVAKGTSLDDALNKKFTIEQELERIVKTQVRGLTSNGFDEWSITPFRKIETGNENLVNSGQAGDSLVLVRSVADLTIVYDAVVTA